MGTLVWPARCISKFKQSLLRCRQLQLHCTLPLLTLHQTRSSSHVDTPSPLLFHRPVAPTSHGPPKTFLPQPIKDLVPTRKVIPCCVWLMLFKYLSVPGNSGSPSILDVMISINRCTSEGLCLFQPSYFSWHLCRCVVYIRGRFRLLSNTKAIWPPLLMPGLPIIRATLNRALQNPCDHMLSHWASMFAILVCVKPIFFNNFVSRHPWHILVGNMFPGDTPLQKEVFPTGSSCFQPLSWNSYPAASRFQSFIGTGTAC